MVLEKSNDKKILTTLLCLRTHPAFNLFAWPRSWPLAISCIAQLGVSPCVCAWGPGGGWGRGVGSWLADITFKSMTSQGWRRASTASWWVQLLTSTLFTKHSRYKAMKKGEEKKLSKYKISCMLSLKSGSTEILINLEPGSVNGSKN